MTDDLMNFDMPVSRSSIIKVIGVGGGGSNAVNYMYEQGITDVNFVVCNTDSQALMNSPVPIKVRLGETLTEGNGAGNKPERGRQAAIESIQDMKRVLEDGTKMVFITAGMGGGTGTGAAPVIAKTAKEMGLLTVGIVTIPFKFEGRIRIDQAIEGISAMEDNVDSLLIINNEKLRDMYGDLKISNAFSKADDVLATAARGIAEIITVHGYINVDFADVETVMKDSGVSIMGSGSGVGEFRAIDAIQSALESPLLNNNNITGAGNILLNITSGTDEITMDEVGQITDHVHALVGKSVDSVIWGTGINNSLEDEVVVTIIATGFAYSNMEEKGSDFHDTRRTRLEMDNEGNLHTVSGPSGDIDIREEELGVDEQETIEFLADELPPRVVNYSDEDKEKKRKFDILYGSENSDEDPFSGEEGSLIVDSGDNNASFYVKNSVGGDNVKVNPEDLNDELRIEELENVPAFKRRKIYMADSERKGKSGDVKVSRFSISNKDSDGSKLSDNNRFLHDNVD
ncbi:cell division protein FtsZ [Marinilabiliaceae bacterium ANBcel2]|nr:cell division protein FtsZ [Marinilabiliaceae bacterium ANBcel2]